jgi:Tol biopolymer transport system component
MGISLIENAVSPDWSPSGDFLMFERDDRLWTAVLATGSVTRVSGLDWQERERNGSWLADTEEDIALFVVDYDGQHQIRYGNINGSKTELFFETELPIEDICGTADGPTVVFSRSDSAGLWRIDGPGGEPVLIENGWGWYAPRQPRFLPQTDIIVYVDEGAEGIDNVYQIDSAGGHSSQLTQDTKENTISCLARPIHNSSLVILRAFSDPVRETLLAYRLILNGEVISRQLELGTYQAPGSITVSPYMQYVAFDYLDHYIRIVPHSGGVTLN